MWSDGEHNRHPTHHRIDIFVSIRPLLLSLFRFREPAKYEFVGGFCLLGDLRRYMYVDVFAIGLKTILRSLIEGYMMIG